MTEVLNDNIGTPQATPQVMCQGVGRCKNPICRHATEHTHYDGCKIKCFVGDECVTCVPVNNNIVIRPKNLKRGRKNA